MLIRYGIIAVKRNPDNPNLADIVHFCGYSEPPTQADYENLKEELETDPEHELVGEMEGVVLMEADEAVLKYFANELKDADPSVLRFEE